MNKSKIDYLYHAERLLNRPGYTLNIVTGCKHGCEYCYAREMVLHGRLKNHPSYPYGFEPTFHPERVKAIGGKPKLIFLNDMGDVGGDWDWKVDDPEASPDGMTGRADEVIPERVAEFMSYFARINPQHIILLLTKNPAWYRLQEWPSNVWCGFTATNNEELEERYYELFYHDIQYEIKWWMSLEPWLDNDAPGLEGSSGWIVIGGLTGKDARPVSRATMEWLGDKSVQVTRFVKTNAYKHQVSNMEAGIQLHGLRQYPAEWRVEDDD